MRRGTVAMTVNGEPVEGTVEVRKTLADFLREDLALTGLKLACEHGVCGSCTVLIDGEPVRSCLLFAIQCRGASVLTVEGLALQPEFPLLQRAFNDNHGLQCGFCTPGMLMTTWALLQDNPRPTEDEIEVGISGNLCRCTGYRGIVRSIEDAAECLSNGRERSAP